MTKARKVHNEDSKMKDLLKDKDLDVKRFKPGDLVEGIVVGYKLLDCLNRYVESRMII